MRPLHEIFMGRCVTRLNSTLGAVFIGGIVLSGCNKSKPENHHGSVLNYSQIDEPRSLDPAFVKDLYEGIVSGFLYSGLVQFGNGKEIEPALAQSWAVSADGKEYRFQLRSNAKFSNDKPVTSDDIRYSFTRIFLPETVSQRKWVLDRIVGAQDVIDGKTKVLSGLETPTSDTVIIKISQAYEPFLQMLAMPTAVIIPDGSAGVDKPNSEFTRTPISSGPWILNGWKNDEKLSFDINPNYWGMKPKVEHLVYNIQTDDNVRFRQFEAGNLDIMQIGFQAYEKWMSDSKLKNLTTSVQELRTDYIGLNCEKDKLANPEIRNAIASAINRELIFDKVQKRRGGLSQSVVPPGIMDTFSLVSLYSFNPDAGKKALEQFHVNNLSLDLLFRDEPQTAEIAAIVKENLEQIGIEVRFVLRDQAGLRQTIHEGGYDMFIGSWTLDFPDVENAVYPPFHSRNIPRQGNMTRYKNSKVDELLDAARNEGNNARRLQLYSEAVSIIEQEKPWIPLYNRKVYYAVNPSVKGWTPALIYNADRFNFVSKSK